MPYFWPLIHDIMKNPALTVHRESRTVHPSEMGITLMVDGMPKRFGGCRRYAYYRLKNYSHYSVPDDFEGMFKKNCGRFVEDLIAEVLKRGWVFVGREVPVSITRKTAEGMRYRISGRIDLVLRDPKTGKPGFIELKTGGDFKSRGNCKPVRKTKVTAEIPLMPDLGECVQALVYLWWVREELGVADPEINLMYFTRDRCHKGEHILSFHHDDSVIIENAAGRHHLPDFTMEKIFEDADRIADCVRAGEVPDRDYEQVWSQERVKNMFKHNRLPKADYEKVQRMLDKGEATVLEKGDWRCNPKYCEYAKGCYGDDAMFVPGGAKKLKVISAGEATTSVKAHIPEGLA